MSARELEQHPQAPIPAAEKRQPSLPGPGGPASLILALQRSAGNAAVVAYLRQPRRSAIYNPLVGLLPPSTTQPVQRCGLLPCDCSDEQRARNARDVDDT